MLGRVQLIQGQYDRARPTMEQAVEANPNSWMAHNLLADVYLQQRDYNKAQQQAQFAIDQGQQAATGAQFVLTYQAADLKRSRMKVGGGSYLSYHDPRMVIGIGKRSKLDWLEVKWPQPSGRTERFSDLPIDRYITIVEGEGKWK